MCHNMAEAGAAIGVAFRAKDPEFKALAFSVAFECIVAGISEPAIYGVNLKLKRPMYAVMIGGAAGGVVAALSGCDSTSDGLVQYLGTADFHGDHSGHDCRNFGFYRSGSSGSFHYWFRPE